MRDLDRRFALLRLSRTFRSRGGGGSSSSSSSTLRLAAAFFGLSSFAAGMRSLGSRRKSARAAASPNRGSLRPLAFFRPHAIRVRRPHYFARTLTPEGLRAGYAEV